MRQKDIRAAGSAPLAVGLWALLLAASLCPCLIRAALPDFASAQAFGFALQQDYRARQGQALVDRLDGEAMKRRAFGMMGTAVLNSPRLQEIWEKEIFPSVVREMKIEGFPTLVVSRILLIDDTRAMECLLVADNGTFRLATLWLKESPGGEIKIQDLRFLGNSLELTRRMRQTFLLLGFPAEKALEPEEMDLEDLSKSNRGIVAGTFSLLADKQEEAAYRAWASATPEFKATRFWQDVRNGMVMNGSAAALKQVDEEFSQGVAGDSFMRFLRASSTGTPEAALAALDDVLVENHQLSFLRVIRAELLLRAGRTEEALQLAEDIYELSPFSTGAYNVAVRAAVKAGKPAAAMQGLRRWNDLVAAADIDQSITEDAALAKFRASPDYLAWKKQAETHPSALKAKPAA